MTTASATVWNDIIGHVRLNQPQLARGWFSELRFEGLDQGVVRIRACNRAQAQYLLRHCRAAFAEAAQAATGRLVSIAFDADALSKSSNYLTDVGIGFETSFELKDYVLFIAGVVAYTLDTDGSVEVRFDIKALH